MRVMLTEEEEQYLISTLTGLKVSDDCPKELREKFEKINKAYKKIYHVDLFQL